MLYISGIMYRPVTRLNCVEYQHTRENTRWILNMAAELKLLLKYAQFIISENNIDDNDDEYPLQLLCYCRYLIMSTIHN